MLTRTADPSILVGTEICQEMSKKGKYMMPRHPFPRDPKYQKSRPKESINAECLDRVCRGLGCAQVKLGIGRF